MLINTVQNNKLIAVIRDSLRRFEEESYQELLSKVFTWSQPEPKKPEPKKPDDKKDDGDIPEPPSPPPEPTQPQSPPIADIA